MAVRRFARLPLGSVAVFASLAVLWALLVPAVAGAARADKLFSATIQPTSVGASVAGQALTVTITNENPAGSTIAIGSIRVAIPSGFSDVAVAEVTTTPNKNWASSVASGVISLNAVTGPDKLSSGQSLRLRLTATTPCPAGAYEWTTRAWVATDFTSSQFVLKGGTTQPTVTVEAGSSATKLTIVSTTDANGNAFPSDVDGHLYVEQGATFRLDVETDAPVCDATEVTITPSSLSGDLHETIPAGGTEVSFPGLSYGSLAPTGLEVCATAQGLTDGCVTVDVLQDVTTVQGCSGDPCLTLGGTGATSTAITTTSSADPQCNPDATNYTCVTVYVPNGVTGTATAVLTPCSPCSTLEVRFLADLSGTTRDDPATMVIACDKTACKGNPANFGLFVDPDQTAGDTFQRAPDCPSKGVVGTNQTYCFDPVQSHKDNASDLILYLLFIRDIKGRG